ncbi:MAG: hypothetical protein ACI94Y_000654 [Maribacter sp.]|jgi:hypothetical protein
MSENFLSNCTWWLLPLLILAFLLGMLFWHLLKVSGLLDKIKELESDNENLNTMISRLEGSLTSKSNALRALQGDYDGLNTEHDVLHSRFTTVQSDYLAERKLKGELEVELEDWKGRFATIETNLTTEKTNYASLQTQYDTDLTVEREAKLAYESDLGTWKSNFTGIETKLALATAAVATWKATNGDLEEKHSQLKKDIEASNNEWNLKWSTFEGDSKSKLTDLETDLVGWRNKYSVLEKSIDQRCLDAAKVFYGKVEKDDLTVVEGIGPKIQGLLHDGGIDTWYKLWKSEYDTLKQILIDAGPRYQMHDPQTWSEQAKLCYYCQWAKLKQWQD